MVIAVNLISNSKSGGRFFAPGKHESVNQSIMFEGRPFPTQFMIDQEWSIEQILSHSEFPVRVAMVCEQCDTVGFNHGEETITSANYFRDLHKLNRLPSDSLASLENSGFLFSEKGEMKSCL